MPRLLSGSFLRKGGSGEFIDLAGAQPQLPESPSTSTGFTIITDALLRTRYASSLGNLYFNQGEIYSNLPDGMIKLTGTNTGFVYVTSSTQSTSTTTGALVVKGGVGIGDTLWVYKDINVNGLTIGQGYQGTNNVVIQGTAVDNINEFNEGRASVAIGFSALTGLSSALKSIAIGRYALSSGTNISNSIAIGDSALKDLGIVDRVPLVSISGATTTTPIQLTVNNHNISTGTQVFIDGVVGMTELNNKSFWVNWLSTNTLELYENNILTVPAIGLNSYISGGTLYRVLQRNNNIAIGSNSGSKLMDGVRNFFFGDAVAPNFTTGSNNFFIGHEVATNMVTGNNNIAIGGDNLVNGQDDQINIGSVFYYDGAGYLQLNSDVGLGLGSASTSTNTGALTVLGGVGISENIWLGGALNAEGDPSAYFNISNGAPKLAFGNADNTLYHRIVSTGTAYDGFTLELKDSVSAIELHSLSSGPDIKFVFSGTQIVSVQPVGVGIGTATPSATLDVNGTVTISGLTEITTTTLAVSSATGALVVHGGTGIKGNLYVGNQTYLDVTSPLVYPSVTPSLFVRNNGSNTSGLVLQNTSSNTNIINYNGQLILSNYAGEFLLTDGTTVILPGLTTVTNTTTSVSASTGALVVKGGVGIEKDLFVDGYVRITSSTESTATNNGALVVDAGVGIGGNLNVGKEFNVRGNSTATISPAGYGDVIVQTRGSGDVQINPDGGGNVYISPLTGDVRIEPILGGSVYINPSNPGTINNMIIGDAPGGAEDAKFQKVHVLDTTESSSSSTGALIVDGGVGITGNVYAKTGNPDESFMLYTPRVFITSGLAPSSPRVGDFWIDSTIPAYLQYIRDGTDTFWIQVGAV